MRVLINGNPIEDIASGIGAVKSFIETCKSEGIWYAVTGQYFDTSLADLWDWIADASDIAIPIAMILIIFSIFGSRRAAKGIYWVAAFYIVIKAVGTVF